jgi:tripartite-type tricarboxylate transporter receptor subunit TctC
MRLARRRFLQLSALALPTLAALPCRAQAQAWPARPIKIVVGFPPGGPNDILARLVAEWLTARLSQKVEVENIASSDDATAAVAHAPADGYTLLLIGPSNAIEATLPRSGDFKSRDFEFRRDLMPVAGITREALAMVVHPSVPARTLEDFFNYAHANPGKVKLAVTNRGTAPQVTGELFRTMSGLDLVAMPFAGGPLALRAVVAGEVAAVFQPLSAAIGPIRDGKVRALAVTTADHAAALPDVPPMADYLSDFEASAVTGIAAPRATPADIVARLNREINAAYADAAMAKRFADTGGEVLAGTSAEFGALFGAEMAKWARLLRLSGAVPR